MKNILKKLFPLHDMGTAGFILAILLATLVITGITISDYLGEGADWYQAGCIGLFLTCAGATYILGKSGK